MVTVAQPANTGRADHQPASIANAERPPIQLEHHVVRDFAESPLADKLVTLIPRKESLSSLQMAILGFFFLLAFVCMIGCMLALAAA